MLAVEEYEEMQVNLELEKDLRKKAESFAQEVSIHRDLVLNLYFLKNFADDVSKYVLKLNKNLPLRIKEGQLWNNVKFTEPGVRRSGFTFLPCQSLVWPESSPSLLGASLSPSVTWVMLPTQPSGFWNQMEIPQKDFVYYKMLL